MSEMCYYYWEEERTVISDQQPPVRRPSVKEKCLVHDKPWEQAVQGVLDGMKDFSVIPNTRDVKVWLDLLLCTCESKNCSSVPLQLRQPYGENLPEEEIEARKWDTVNFYQNLFNQLSLLSDTHIRSTPLKCLLAIKSDLMKIIECYLSGDKKAYDFLHVIKLYLVKPHKGIFHVQVDQEKWPVFFNKKLFDMLSKRHNVEIYLDSKAEEVVEGKLGFFVEASCASDFSKVRAVIERRAKSVMTGDVDKLPEEEENVDKPTNTDDEVEKPTEQPKTPTPTQKDSDQAEEKQTETGENKKEQEEQEIASNSESGVLQDTAKHKNDAPSSTSTESENPESDVTQQDTAKHKNDALSSTNTESENPESDVTQQDTAKHKNDAPSSTNTESENPESDVTQQDTAKHKNEALSSTNTESENPESDVTPQDTAKHKNDTPAKNKEQNHAIPDTETGLLEQSQPAENNFERQSSALEEEITNMKLQVYHKLLASDWA